VYELIAAMDGENFLSGPRPEGHFELEHQVRGEGKMTKAHFILYVADQERSRAFYSRVFNTDPRLHVDGMTEFELDGGGVLGLMPESGVKKLLGIELPDPVRTSETPRAELYLIVDDPKAYHQRALASGAQELSSGENRDWGHEAGYSLDPDGHVIAFAKKLGSPESGF